MFLFYILLPLETVFYECMKFTTMENNNDIFCMLSYENKLDRKNYLLWTYIMHHVLVVKGSWNVVIGIEVDLHLMRNLYLVQVQWRMT